MFKKRNFATVMWPAVVLFFVVFITGCLRDYWAYSSFNVYFMLSWVVTALLFEVFAYMTCWALVIRKGRSQDMVWLNYTIWFLIPALSNIAEMIGL